MRKTKIVCTIGPASSSEETFIAMCKAGLNVARLNFSHGTHEEHKKKIDMIKKHLNLLRETKNDKVALLEIRTHIAYYLKGLKNSSELKNMIFKTKSFEEIEALLNEYKEKYND